MALVKFGSIIVDSRGRIGGHQLHASHYGVQLQRLNIPTQRPTPRRSLRRAMFATLSKSWWQDLDVGQRDDWRSLAAANPFPNRWGDLFALTGLAFYIRANLLLWQCGLSTTLDAPTDQVVTAPTAFSISLTAPSTVSVTFTATPAPSNHLPYVLVTGPQSPGVSTASGRYAFVGAGSVAQTSPWDVASLFTSRLGDVIAGRKYFAELHFLNSVNAAPSAPLYADAIAA